MTDEITASHAETGRRSPSADQSARLRREGDGLNFGDILDAINPLQHIPIVSTLYRGVTGDAIGAAPRLVGGAIFGGILGFVSAAANAILAGQTGKDAGDHLLAMFDGETESPGAGEATQAATVSIELDPDGYPLAEASARWRPTPEMAAALADEDKVAAQQVAAVSIELDPDGYPLAEASARWRPTPEMAAALAAEDKVAAQQVAAVSIELDPDGYPFSEPGAYAGTQAGTEIGTEIAAVARPSRPKATIEHAAMPGAAPAQPAEAVPDRRFLVAAAKTGRARKFALPADSAGPSAGVHPGLVKLAALGRLPPQFSGLVGARAAAQTAATAPGAGDSVSNKWLADAMLRAFEQYSAASRTKSQRGGQADLTR